MEKLFLALWLAMLAVTSGEGGPFGLSELQKKTVDSIVNDFNSNPKQQHAHKMASVRSKEEHVMSEGKTVTLEFILRPTICKKEKFQPEKCPYRIGRWQVCVACFKYDDDVNPQTLDKFWDCIPLRSHTTERKKQQQQKCEDVKTEQEPMIGVFSFLKSGPD
ncbi:retinoic acid receptor responder protein 2-like [Ambystoma mexicanum]|uniref:retinoic acid receptor responder protein 2-like n=1 Tax=Ambystoma mexicanum TaxID=8296 RepID=UPI0037E9B469